TTPPPTPGGSVAGADAERSGGLSERDEANAVVAGHVLEPWHADGHDVAVHGAAVDEYAVPRDRRVTHPRGAAVDLEATPEPRRRAAVVGGGEPVEVAGLGRDAHPPVARHGHGGPADLPRLDAELLGLAHREAVRPHVARDDAGAVGEQRDVRRDEIPV